MGGDSIKTGILFFGWWFVRNWRGTSNNRLTWAINGEENLTLEDLLLSKKYDAINWRNSTQCVIPAHYHGLHPLFGGVNHRKIKLRHNFPAARAGTKLRHIITPFKSHSRNWVGGKTYEKKRQNPLHCCTSSTWMTKKGNHLLPCDISTVKC